MAKRPEPTAGERAFAAPFDEVLVPACLAALMKGEATPEQQVEGMTWIIRVACMTYEQPFVPGDPHATSFISGRMFAGQKILTVAKLNGRAIAKAKES